MYLNLRHQYYHVTHKLKSTIKSFVSCTWPFTPMSSFICLFNRQNKRLLWLRYFRRWYHGAGCYGHSSNKGLIPNNEMLTGRLAQNKKFSKFVWIVFNVYCSWGGYFSQSDKGTQSVAAGSDIQGARSLYGFLGPTNRAYPVSPAYYTHCSHPCSYCNVKYNFIGPQTFYFLKKSKIRPFQKLVLM